MTRYDVYLEVGQSGESMGHVLQLPGCVATGADADAALASLVDAIVDYHDWLRWHSDPSRDDTSPITLTVAEVSSGVGPFKRGDRAALFEPDHVPLSAGELSTYLRYASYSRADLLALTRDLPDDILDWREAPEEMSIREILRHVGDAEQWYVSRLVDPDSLPPEWRDDDDLPVFDFLEMERRTAVRRLRDLTGAQLRRVVYPTHFTDHPDEPWTARKALRRLVEHEREHVRHTRDILAAWRAALLDQLAAERAALLVCIAEQDETTLTTVPIVDQLTGKDVLAHIAAWDELFADLIRYLLAERVDRVRRIGSLELDDRNAQFYAERRDWTLEQALSTLTLAREQFLGALRQVSDAELHRIRQLPWGEATISTWTTWRARHDAQHAADIRRALAARAVEGSAIADRSGVA